MQTISGTIGQGNSGGTGAGYYGIPSGYAGGGGGGAATDGGNSSWNGDLAIAGHGGDGRIVFMTGSPMALAGGGGGGVASNGQSAGNGGLGGGGAGSKGTATASDGVPNTGGGGGGSGFLAGSSTNGANGSGGSGIVIVRYKKYVTPPRLQSIDFTDCLLFLDAEESLSYSGSGGTWNDLMGRSHGTLGNSPSFLASSPKAFSFNGSNQYVDLQLSNPGGNWAHSISFWMRVDVDSLSTRVDPFQLGTQTPSKSSSLDVYDTYMLWYFYANDVYFTYPSLPKRTWMHICLTYNGGSTVNDRHMYLNGVDQTLIKQTGHTITAPNLPTNMIGSLGRDRGRNNAYFPGSIAQFGVWSRVLSPGEIQAMYDQFKGEY